MPARRAQLDPAEAGLVVLASFALVWTVGARLVGRLGIPGTALAELAFVLAPAALLARARGVDVGHALGLGRPRLAALAGGALAGAGAFYLVSAVVEALQERIAPLPPALKDELRRVILPATGPRPLAVDLVALALVPALCEEALFRGALLRSLVADGLAPSGARRAAAVGLAALAFGLFHASGYKLVPTGALGVVLGAIALASGSLWPAVALHATNNVLVVLLVRAGYDEPPALTTALGAALGAASLVAVWAGLRIARAAAPTG